MYRQGMIVKGGELTEPSYNGDAFLLFPMPKSDDAPEILVVSAKCSGEGDGEFHDVPLNSGMWNPVLLEEVQLSDEQLASYRFFYGMEG